MQNVKLIKEPDCWCGPNSSIAEPEPFRDIAEDHFNLQDKDLKELEDLITKKGRVNEFGLPPPVDFKLRGVSEATARKQEEMARALHASMHRMKVHPEETMKEVEELWKLNNIMVYDLSNIEYDHSQALKSMNELNKRLQTSPEAIEVEEIDQSNYRPQFTSKRMKLENVKASPAKKYMPTIEYDD